MAALLVTLSVMAVMLSVALPAWKQNAQREKETELVFRGQQYARAIGLFQRKHGPGTLPPTLDVLLEEHALRKKYKDPIANDDFDVLRQGQAGTAAVSATQPGGAATTRSAPPSPTAAPGASLGATGGIIGVASKSPAQSIRIYNGRTYYNEWYFVYQPPVQAPGSTVPGAVPGVGGRGAAPGAQPGNPTLPAPTQLPLRRP